jgi:hypothetical protein
MVGFDDQLRDLFDWNARRVLSFLASAAVDNSMAQT